MLYVDHEWHVILVRHKVAVTPPGRRILIGVREEKSRDTSIAFLQKIKMKIGCKIC